MRNLPQAYRRLLVVYAAVGVLLWAVPLLSILHAESSALIAAVSFFGAGISTHSLLREGHDFRRVLLLEEAALVIPWLLLTLSLLWQPNCGYLQGLMFYILFPGLTVPLGVGLMIFLRALHARRPVLLLTTIGLLVVAFPPIYDVGFHPQFYTYNHVFGGLLGPVYDNQLAIRPGLFAFRALTVFWFLFLLFVASFVSKRMSVYPAALTGLAIALCYAFAVDLGIITTEEYLQKQLGGVRHTTNFNIYYDSKLLSEAEVDRIADHHEYHYDRLARRLNVGIEERIDSYIYPDPETKARLTGARYTNVAPVWLKRPQAHVLYASYADVFPHELAHVFSREFGLPLIRASLAVGLVEGFAVSMEPASGAPSPREQMSAAILSRRGGARDALGRADQISRAIASRLSPIGFWTGRGAVSYTAMGSFVEFLLDVYGAERFKRAYAWANFPNVYGKSAEELASEWTDYVLGPEAVSASAHDVVSNRFAVPSLFEMDCPHYIPSHQRRYEAAITALLWGDSTRAVTLLDDAVGERPEYVRAFELWAALKMDRGAASEVVERVTGAAPDSLSATLLVRLGDAYAQLHEVDEARKSYDAALARLPGYAYEARSLTLLRLAALREHEPGSATRALEAIRIGGKKRYEQAFALMRTTSAVELIEAVPVPGDELARRRLAWLARFAYESGLFADAATLADSAAAVYSMAGAYNEAAVWEEYRMMVEWTAGRELEQMAGALRIVRR